MSEAPYFRFFASDWLGGTRGMTAAETGVYITLIAMMYERCEPLENEPPRLARLCGASNSSFKAIMQTLIDTGKIILVDGRLWNGRVEKEVSYRREKSEVGSHAAKSRWGVKGNEIKAPTDANAMRTQCERNANPESIVHSPEKKDSEAKASAVSAPVAGEILAPEPDPDPMALAWKTGVSLLGAAGIREGPARSFLGGLAKQYGQPILLIAIGETHRINPADPRAYLTKTCQSAQRRATNEPPAASRSTVHDNTRDFAADLELQLARSAGGVGR